MFSGDRSNNDQKFKFQRECKVACNGTNSAAVDQEGRLWVWGSGRFGLLGKKGDRKFNQFVPHHLRIPSEATAGEKNARNSASIEEAYKRQEPLSNQQSKRHVVKDISMGPFHMGIITSEEELRGETQAIIEAREIFQKVKNHFLMNKDEIIKNIHPGVVLTSQFQKKFNETKLQEVKNLIDKEKAQKKQTKEKMSENEEELFKKYAKETMLFEDSNIIEWGLMQQFQNDLATWPYIKSENFSNMLYKTCQINFTKNLGRITDELARDLQGGENENMMNVKQLRDILLGEKMYHSKIWLWGLQDERVGYQMISLANLTDEEINEKDKKKNPNLQSYEELQQNFDDYQEPTEFPIREAKADPVKIVCGNSYCLVLTKLYQVWSWGIGNSGSLGERFPTSAAHQATAKPMMIVFPEEKILNRKIDVFTRSTEQTVNKVKIKAIASGSSHCLALTTNGNVYSWGNGQGGRLGHGDSIGKDTPIQIQELTKHVVEQIACGDSHSACITSKQQLYMWGVGLHGRLGLSLDQDYMVPELVQDLSQSKIEKVFLGFNTSFAIDKSTMCYVWGSGKYGKLGQGSDDKNYSQPRKLFSFQHEQITEFATGPFHTLALTNSGKIFSFGNSKDGKLGIPQEVIGLKGTQCSDRLQSNSYNLLLPQQIEVHDGKNYVLFNQMNKRIQIVEQCELFKSFTDEFTVDLRNKEEPNVMQVVCNQNNSYFLMSNGQVWGCGQNENYQLCTVDTEDQDENQKFQDFIEENKYDWLNSSKEGDKVKNDIIKLPRKKTVKEPRQIRIWVSNQHVKVEERIRHIACGAKHVIVTTVNGQCYVWGDNSQGQLGIFEEKKKFAKPRLVEFFSDRKMKMAAAGYNHSLFLSELGQVFSAGFNEFGQLGIQVDEVSNTSDKIENWVTVLKESAIRQVFGLEGIRFIACGAYHSLALSGATSDGIRAYSLYSWGWGANGQLGHSQIKNQFNQSQPKYVKFRQDQSTKIAYVAAGSKHTLCLDTEGSIWYFGSKEAVGIQTQERHQYEPIKLKPKPSNPDFDSFRKGVSLVAASDNNNYALTFAEKKVFNFGIQLTEELKKKTNKQDKLNNWQLDDGEGEGTRKVHCTNFKPISNFQAKYISCGPKHSILVKYSNNANKKEIDGLPYAWGDNSNYRFGKPKKNEDEENEEETKYIEEPIVVHPFENEFKNQLKQIEYRNFEELVLQNQKPKHLQQSKEIAATAQNRTTAIRWIRFDIQEDIQNGKLLTNEELVSKDAKLREDFNHLTRTFYRMLQKEHEKISISTARAQDALISRIYNFPTPIQHLDKITNNIPKTIIRNRQIYEQIFTYLQVHPCYLINWINLVCEEGIQVQSLISAVFGKREVVNNKRIISTLMVIANNVFKFEMRKRTIKEVTSTFRNESMFKTIFDYIYEHQTQNVNFNMSIISHLFIRHLFPQLGEMAKGELKEFKYEEIKEEIMEVIDQEIKKSIDQFGQTQFKDESSQLSNEVISLVNHTYHSLLGYASKENWQEQKKPEGEHQDPRVIKQIEQNAEHTGQNDLIVPYLLDLLFGSLIRTLQTLDYSRINMHFWIEYAKQKSPKDKEQPNKMERKFPMKHFKLLQSPLSRLIRELEDIIRCKDEKGNPYDPLKDQSGKKPICEIAKKIFAPQTWRPHRLELLLVRQMFTTSLEEIKEPNLVVDVSSIIFVQNTLIEHADKILLKFNHQIFEDDPIRILLDEIGNVKMKSKISPQIERQRMNFQISARLLLQQAKFVRCHDCTAPVTKLMINRDLFKDAHKGPEWQCPKCRDGQENKRGVEFCPKSSCQAFIPYNQMPKNIIFDRYTYEQPEENQRLFFEVLSLVPIIEEGGEFIKILEKEINFVKDRESDRERERFGMDKNKKNLFVETDYYKKQKLTKFKEKLEAHLREKEHDSINLVSSYLPKPEDKKSLARSLIERTFLNGLADKIRLEMQQIKFHQARLLDYENLMSQIKQLKLRKEVHTINICHDLNQIHRNTFNGISSEFLRDILQKQEKELTKANMNKDDNNSKKDYNANKTMLWAGRLHQNDNIANITRENAEVQEKKDIDEQEQMTGSGSDNIVKYFDKVGKNSENIKAENETKKKQGDGTGSNKDGDRSLIGTFSTVELQQMGVLKDKSRISYDKEVLRESKFVFRDDEAGGFTVELRYSEPQVKVGNQEVVLESFQISREQLSEIRRNFACQMVAIFGRAQFQFDVFQLLKVLNKVISKNNVFAETAKELYSQSADTDFEKKKKGKDKINREEDKNVVLETQDQK